MLLFLRAVHHCGLRPCDHATGASVQFITVVYFPECAVSDGGSRPCDHATASAEVSRVQFIMAVNVPVNLHDKFQRFIVMNTVEMQCSGV